MKLNEIVQGAGELLGNPDIAEGDTNYNILFRCANLVVANIASNYFDILNTQTFVVVNEKINYSQFAKTLLKIKSVKMAGFDVQHELFINYIKVPNGTVTVEYACVPSFTNGNEDSSVAGCVSDTTLMYGILAEYAYISGMYNEAQVWNEKFEQMLFAAGLKGKAKTMPSR